MPKLVFARSVKPMPKSGSRLKWAGPNGSGMNSTAFSMGQNLLPRPE